MIRRLIALVSLLALSGCGVAVVAPPPAQSLTAEPTAVVEAHNPTDVKIGRLGISSSLIPLGLLADGTHDVPPVTTPQQAGWFEPGPEPGQVGPAIVLGHIDGGGQKGVFWRLREVVVGDEIEVTLDNGVALVFTVTETEQAPKSAFPAQKVYGKTDRREIRLITCGGVFDHGVRSYKDNTIVYGVLKQ